MARVLVVEDDADIQGLVERRLTNAGHRVITCSTSDEALAAVAERGAPDLAVLDVGLPGTDGFTLLDQLRRETDADLPAVFLTARILDSDIARGRAMGAQYLTKPFVATALLAAVERALAPRAQGW